MNHQASSSHFLDKHVISNNQWCLRLRGSIKTEILFVNNKIIKMSIEKIFRFQKEPVVRIILRV